MEVGKAAAYTTYLFIIYLISNIIWELRMDKRPT